MEKEVAPAVTSPTTSTTTSTSLPTTTSTTPSTSMSTTTSTNTSTSVSATTSTTTSTTIISTTASSIRPKPIIVLTHQATHKPSSTSSTTSIPSTIKFTLKTPYCQAGVKGEVAGVKGEVAGVKGEVEGVKGEVEGVKGEVEHVSRETGGRGELGARRGQLGVRGSMVSLLVSRPGKRGRGGRAAIEPTVASTRPRRQVTVKEEEVKEVKVKDVVKVKGVMKVKGKGKKPGTGRRKILIGMGKKGARGGQKIDAKKRMLKRKLSGGDGDGAEEPPTKKAHVVVCVERALIPKIKLRKMPLYKLLSLYLRSLQRKDVEGVFAKPVTDSIAPEYSSVIEKPMDFKTMRNKLDRGEYSSLNQFRADFEVMCLNAMTYNNPTTFYFKEGEKMLVLGRLLMSEKKLEKIKNRRGLEFLKKLSEEQLGCALFGKEVVVKKEEEDEKEERVEGENNEEDKMEMENIEEQKQKPPSKEPRDTKRATTPPALTPLVPISSDVIMMAGGKSDGDEDAGGGDGSGTEKEMSVEEVKEMIVSDMDEFNVERLEAVPNELEGVFNRRSDAGTTSLPFINPDLAILPGESYTVPLSSLLPKVKHGGHFQDLKPRDDVRGLVKPVKYLHYGPYSSHAPAYDSCFATITNDDTRLLLTEFGENKLVDVKISEDPIQETIDQTHRFLSIFQPHAATTSSSTTALVTAPTTSTTAPTTASAPATEAVIAPILSGRTASPTAPVALELPVQQEAVMAGDGQGTADDYIDMNLCNAAHHISHLIEQQQVRLNQPVPGQLRALPRPNEEELMAAEQVQESLVGLVKLAQPCHVASEGVIRKTLSINL